MGRINRKAEFVNNAVAAAMPAGAKPDLQTLLTAAVASTVAQRVVGKETIVGFEPTVYKTYVDNPDGSKRFVGEWIASVQFFNGQSRPFGKQPSTLCRILGAVDTFRKSATENAEAYKRFKAEPTKYPKPGYVEGISGANMLWLLDQDHDELRQAALDALQMAKDYNARQVPHNDKGKPVLTT